RQEPGNRYAHERGQFCCDASDAHREGQRSPQIIHGLATVLTALMGVPLAWFLARTEFRGKSIVDSLLTVPIILPPTVVGYLLILLLGVQSPIGVVLNSRFGFRMLFTEGAAVLAAVVVAFPLLLIPARAAFADIERELEDMARLMGAGPLRLFWHVSLPLARRGIAGGLLLAFARSLGEFGATVMVFGVTRKTLPILIWYENESSSLSAAAPAVCVLLVVSLSVIFIFHRAGFARRER
ncbi:MAG: molybdate ABC transporter permease subunit, partial [Phycisphaerae bacterium]|nr:molybdate ABC transporter permease subunit [Phycisphaerae bacterium]